MGVVSYQYGWIPSNDYSAGAPRESAATPGFHQSAAGGSSRWGAHTISAANWAPITSCAVYKDAITPFDEGCIIQHPCLQLQRCRLSRCTCWLHRLDQSPRCFSDNIKGSCRHPDSFPLSPGISQDQVSIVWPCWYSGPSSCPARTNGLTQCYVPNHLPISSLFYFTFSHESLWLIFHFLRWVIMTHYHESLWAFDFSHPSHGPVRFPVSNSNSTKSSTFLFFLFCIFVSFFK